MIRVVILSVLAAHVFAGGKIESSLDLRLAATNGNLYEVKRLLQDDLHKIAIDALDYGGQTPLMRACYGGHAGIVNTLLNEGADANIEGKHGRTALISAAAGAKTKAHLEVVRELMSHGVEVSGLAMAVASQQGHTDFVHELEREAPEELREKVALLLAAGQGDEEKVKALLEEGVDPNSHLENGWSPLMEASAKGHLMTVTHLLLAGAKIKTKAANGESAMSVAKVKNHDAVVEQLRTFKKKRKAAKEKAKRDIAKGKPVNGGEL